VKWAKKNAATEIAAEENATQKQRTKENGAGRFQTVQPPSRRHRAALEGRELLPQVQVVHSP
jgi:hypothetical protein